MAVPDEALRGVRAAIINALYRDMRWGDASDGRISNAGADPGAAAASAGLAFHDQLVDLRPRVVAATGLQPRRDLAPVTFSTRHARLVEALDLELRVQPDLHSNLVGLDDRALAVAASEHAALLRMRHPNLAAVLQTSPDGTSFVIYGDELRREWQMMTQAYPQAAPAEVDRRVTALHRHRAAHEIVHETVWRSVPWYEDFMNDPAMPPRQRLAAVALMEGHADFVANAEIDGKTAPEQIDDALARIGPWAEFPEFLEQQVTAPGQMRYTVANLFVARIVGEVGLPTFNRMWGSLENLPTLGELVDHRLALDRFAHLPAPVTGVIRPRPAIAAAPLRANARRGPEESGMRRRRR